MTAIALSIVQKIELVDKEESTAAKLVENTQIFIVYIAIMETMLIYLT